MTKDQIQEMLDTALEQQVCHLFQVYVASIEQDYKAMIPFKQGMVKALKYHKAAVDMLKDIM